jgi:AcrR family transcriptional regulator
MNGLAERRREEKERRRDEILDAAAAVAAESGIDAVTMDQVAQRARLSRALLYVYFHDRTDLQLGLCVRALELLRDRFAAVVAAAPTGRERLAGMGLAYVEFARELPVYFEVLARFEAARPSDIDPAPEGSHLASCLALGDAVHQMLTDALQAGVADGSVRADIGNADGVATVLWGFMHGAIQLASTKQALLNRRGLTADAMLQQALDLALHALAGGKP